MKLKLTLNIAVLTYITPQLLHSNCLFSMLPPAEKGHGYCVYIVKLSSNLVVNATLVVT